MGIKVGDISITPILELGLPSPARFLIPEATPENLEPYSDWLKPHHVAEDGMLQMVVQAFLVESRGLKIVIDTCIGNDKKRGVPAWNELDGPFLRNISDAGFPREKVDLVICTHLHIDHVGWNTMKVDDQWVPTFPNATYLFAKPEYEFWRDQTEDKMSTQVFGDSVAPVFEAGLVKLVECDHDFTPEVKFRSTPGHTPGHCSVVLSSGSEESIITGDLMHHPSQVANPHWGCTFDTDAKKAEQTRRTFLDQYVDSGLPVIGTHWAGPLGVHLVKEKGCCRIVERS